MLSRQLRKAKGVLLLLYIIILSLKYEPDNVNPEQQIFRKNKIS